MVDGPPSTTPPLSRYRRHHQHYDTHSSLWLRPRLGTWEIRCVLRLVGLPLHHGWVQASIGERIKKGTGWSSCHLEDHMGVPRSPNVWVFVWQFISNSFATCALWNLETNNMCLLCGVECEDSFHVMCRCPRVVDLCQAMEMDWAIEYSGHPEQWARLALWRFVPIVGHVVHGDVDDIITILACMQQDHAQKNPMPTGALGGFLN